jgi:uncharacterized membrane-anchored protein YhcB (DUF1043 family)
MMIGAVLTCLVNGAAMAQDKPADEMEILRERARADKKLVVATALALTEGEAKVFWPVYNAYQSDMITHYDKLLSLVDRFEKSYDSMTDQTATQLLNEYLALEANHIALLKAYVPRFQRVLPALKVARLYQIENKMRALVNYDLARHIRFIK